MEFEEQITDLELMIDTSPRFYLKWVNTEEGRDKTSCYERVIIGGTVIYINANNRNSSIICGDPFWNTLENMYNNIKNKEEIVQIKYNHDRTLDSFQKDITLLKEHGFNPIGVSQMYFEDVFIFETKKEATKAYNTFECDENGNLIRNIIGWWYSKKNFLKEVEKYENAKDSTKVLVYWL